MQCSTENKSCGKKPCNWAGKIAGLVIFFLTAFGAGCLTWGHLFFKVWHNDEFAHLMRPMDDKMWHYMPVAYFVYALVFIILYKKFAFNICSPCGTNFGRGAVFGLYLWLLMGIVPAFFVLITQPVNINYVSIMLVDNFLTLVIGGGLVGLVFRKPYCEKSQCESKSEEDATN
jgi:hypothetical protein